MRNAAIEGSVERVIKGDVGHSARTKVKSPEAAASGDFFAKKLD